MGERKNNREYNTEYVRKKRGSIRRQEYGNVLEGAVTVKTNIKSDLAKRFKEKALLEHKGVSQVLRELIEGYLRI